MTTEHGHRSDVVTELFGLTPEELAKMSDSELRDYLANLQGRLSQVYAGIHEKSAARAQIEKELEELHTVQSQLESQFDAAVQQLNSRGGF